MSSFIRKAYDLYYEGFRDMTVGRTLWIVIAVKIFIIFVVLKLLFFPNFISSNAPDGQEADFVAEELTNR